MESVDYSKSVALVTTHYTSLLKAYTAYDIQVFAVTASIGNVTYASRTVSIQTQEGGMSLLLYHVLSISIYIYIYFSGAAY